MKRGRASFALLTILLALLLGGCTQKTELNPEVMTTEETASLDNYTGNVKVLGIDGVVYKAQTLKSAEGDFLHLINVEIIDDGVVSRETELMLAKERVSKIELQKNNKWVVGGALAGISFLILVLYYQINGSF